MSDPSPLAELAEALLELLRRRRHAPGAVVVDLASDAGGAITSALQGAGLVPLGVAEDQARADRLASAGVEVVTGELSKPDTVFEDILLALGERHVAAVWLGDLPARLPDMAALVRAAHWFCEQTSAALALSVPNVTHVDVGTKLLLGRWEPRPGGVLDDTHVRRFSAASLRATMATLGWAEVDAEDLERADSDQHFPTDAVPLQRTTPVGAELAAVREMAGAGAYDEQLVRLYEAVLPEPQEAVGAAVGDGAAGTPGAPFLSVLVRTQGKRWETLQETLLCLAAQTCDDFEVIVLVHDPEPGTADATASGAEGSAEGSADASAAGSIEDLVSEFHPSFSLRVRVLEVSGGGRCRPLNEGAREARGRYLATLDDDDLVFAHWVEAMRTAGEQSPGHAVRVGVATQQIEATPGTWAGDVGYQVISRPRLDYPLTFDYVDHLRDNLTPNNGYAVPRSVISDLGQGWDETLPVLEDWDHLLRVAAICGVADVPTVAAMVRVWANAENSKTMHLPDIWEETRQRIVAQQDAAPLLLDTGYVSRLRALLLRLDDVPELELRLEQRAQEIEQLRDEIARLTGEAMQSMGEVHRLQSEIVQLNDQLNSQIDHLHNQIDQLHNQIAQRDAEIAQLRDEIARLTDQAMGLMGEVHRLHSDLDQRHAEMGQLRDEIARLTDQAMGLMAELAASEDRRRIADEAVAALQAARDDLRRQLDAVFSSRSWRLTETLRKAAGVVRRYAAAPKELLRGGPRGQGRREE